MSCTSSSAAAFTTFPFGSDYQCSPTDFRKVCVIDRSYIFLVFSCTTTISSNTQPASQQLGSSVYLFRPLPKSAIRLLLVLLAAHSTHVILCSLFSPYISSLYVCLCVFLSVRLSVSYLFAGAFYLVYSKFIHSIVKYAIVILMEHLFKLLTFPLIDNFPLNFYFLWQMKKNSRCRKKYTENKTDDFDST